MVKIINSEGVTIIYHPQKKRDKTFEEKNPGYNPEVDWSLVHIRLLKENKSYSATWAGVSGHGRYLDFIVETYMKNVFHNKNKSAYCNYRDDFKAIHEKIQNKKTATEEAAIHFGLQKEDVAPKTKKWFVTFNWAPDCSNFDIKHIVDVGIPSLFTKSYVVNARGVFEFYSSDERKGQNHPHFMCILEVLVDKKTAYKSSFVEKMVEATIAKGLARNYVKVLPHGNYHDAYVDLDKCEEKQEALAKDVVWRQEHLLKEEYRREDYVK